MNKILPIILVVVLSGCASYRSHLVNTLPTEQECVQMGITDPHVMQTCIESEVLTGGLEMYKEDYDVYYSTLEKAFHKHSRQKSIFWQNKKTGSRGEVKINQGWMEGNLRCLSYDSNFTLEGRSLLMSIFSLGIARWHAGVACQLPDGRWIEKPRGIGLHPDWKPIVADPNGCGYRHCNDKEYYEYYGEHPPKQLDPWDRHRPANERRYIYD